MHKISFENEHCPGGTVPHGIKCWVSLRNKKERLVCMILHKEGETSKALCDHCKEIVPVTFRYADLKAHGLVIPDILQGFCDNCGEPVSLPHQSTYNIGNVIDSGRDDPAPTV